MLIIVASWFHFDGELWPISKLERWADRAGLAHKEQLAAMSPEARAAFLKAMEANRGKR